MLLPTLASFLLPVSVPQAEAGAPAKRALFEPELTVLHEFVGEAAGDQFGWIGRNIGDCDGDGVNDVLLSAPMKALGGPAAGRIYAYSGKTGKLHPRREARPPARPLDRPRRRRERRRRPGRDRRRAGRRREQG